MEIDDPEQFQSHRPSRGVAVFKVIVIAIIVIDLCVMVYFMMRR